MERRSVYLVLPFALGLLLTACGSRKPVEAQIPQADKPSPIQQQPQAMNVPQQQASSAQPAFAEGAPPQPAPARMPDRSLEAEPAPVQAAPMQSRREPAPASVEPAPRRAAAARFAGVSIPSGAILDVRIDETLDTRKNRAGDRFDATLTRPVVVDGRSIIPRGTHFTGHVVESRSSGRLKGRAELSLRLDSFEFAGQRYEIDTSYVARQSGGHKKRNWTLIGGGSGLGTALGAIAGGPAGALIGAGAGAGAGTAGAVITGKKQVRLRAETPLAFTLRRPVPLGD